MNNPVTEDKPAGASIEPFKFSGEAGEFFGIWFVNNFLTMLTLGIYSPWAKVKNLQYFYGSTELAGGAFNFTADPWSILKTRIIAFILLVAFVISDNYPSTIATVVYVAFIIAYLLVSPILTVLIMSFKLRYSAWRGIHFSFNKDFVGAYRVFFAPIVVFALFIASFTIPLNSIAVEEFLGMDTYEKQQEQAALEPEPIEEVYDIEGNLINCEAFDPESDDYPIECMSEEEIYINPLFMIPVGLMFLIFIITLPYFDFIGQRYLARNIRFGTAQVQYTANAGSYYILYWRWLLATTLLISVWILKIWSDYLDNTPVSWWVISLVTLLYFPISTAYLKSKRYNLFWGQSVINNGEFKILANVPFPRFAYILTTNTIMVMITFGMMTAWAKVRAARIILDNTALEINGSLDSFIAAETDKQSALGEEIADVFDLDMGI